MKLAVNLFKFSAHGSLHDGHLHRICGAASYVVVVPGGEERLAVIPVAALTNSVLAVAQGTNMPLPFAVMME